MNKEIDRKINKLNIGTKLSVSPKGGVLVNEVLALLKRYDRMPENGDFPSEEFIEMILDKYGYLTLFVFICPDTRAKYLKTDQKERFMPVEEPSNGLLWARIPKLKLLVSELWGLGVPTKLLFVVADNSYELYRGPVEGLLLDKAKMDARRELYAADLKKRLGREFPQMFEVFSLGLNDIGLAFDDVAIPSDVIQVEVNFQQQVVYGQYYDNAPEVEVIESIAKGKCRAYAEQGTLIEMTDAIWISTEGSDTLATWRLRNRMLRLAGANFPVIYPYIRKEILEQ